MGFSPQMLEATEHALDDQPRGAREIWKRVEAWAPTSIRHALEELVRQKRAIRTGDEARRLYSRKTPSNSGIVPRETAETA